MKTYTVTLPENPHCTLVALVDTLLRGFQLAINSASSTYSWNNLNVGYAPGDRWFDTNCPNAVAMLKLELSNLGVSVEPQSVSYTTEEA